MVCGRSKSTLLVGLWIVAVSITCSLADDSHFVQNVGNQSINDDRDAELSNDNVSRDSSASSKKDGDLHPLKDRKISLSVVEGKDRNLVDEKNDDSDYRWALDGFKDRIGETDGSKDRIGHSDGSKDRILNSDGSKDRILNSDGSKDRIGHSDGSKDRIGHSDGSKDGIGHSDGSKDGIGNSYGPKDRIENLPKEGKSRPVYGGSKYLSGMEWILQRVLGDASGNGSTASATVGIASNSANITTFNNASTAQSTNTHNTYNVGGSDGPSVANATHSNSTSPNKIPAGGSSTALTLIKLFLASLYVAGPSAGIFLISPIYAIATRNLMDYFIGSPETVDLLHGAGIMGLVVDLTWGAVN